VGRFFFVGIVRNRLNPSIVSTYFTFLRAGLCHHIVIELSEFILREQSEIINWDIVLVYLRDIYTVSRWIAATF
jgi:hypothetical protein